VRHLFRRVEAEMQPRKSNGEDTPELTPEIEMLIYREMLEEDPKNSALWFDYGLACKRACDWKTCIDANLKALELKSAPGDPAWWNLGIAATAVRDWDLARRAWRGYGLEIEGESGPIECDYHVTPVRLPRGEIVWGPRIDPARAVVRNIPLAGSEYRWGDIVLLDGAPNGEREVNGIRHAVFDVLERWSSSEIPTLTCTVRCRADSDAEALFAVFDNRGFSAEDWTTNVRSLCKGCSEGLPPPHAHSPLVNEGDRHFGLACPMGLARELLADWKAVSPSRRQFDEPAFA
jgi:hypothetical protein